MNRLINYLLDNLMLDFRGELSLEQVREMLKEDESRDSRILLARLIEDRGVDDLLVTLADCLKDYLQEGISSEKIREQLNLYAEA